MTVIIHIWSKDKCFQANISTFIEQIIPRYFEAAFVFQKI